MVRAREERKIQDLVVIGQVGERDGVYSVCWDRDGRRPGGQMIPCRGRTEYDNGGTGHLMEGGVVGAGSISIQSNKQHIDVGNRYFLYE